MKRVLGLVSIVFLAAALSFAQNAGSGNSGAGTDTMATQNGGNNGGNNGGGHNWGWIGLLGLAGLGGMRGRRQYSSTDRDRDVTNIRRAA
jgi:MYXO-CTERM domain-containing protein